MNDELPDGPEYVFAQAVIDRLAGKKELANYVIPDPFDASDQVNNLALAVGPLKGDPLYLVQCRKLCGKVVELVEADV